MEMIGKYIPSEYESLIYKNWEEKGYFKAVVDSNKKPFSIVIPPPNITGQLHMGHALNDTLQDIIIRFKRMQGYSVLWQPGTDHASIATEVKIVEQMKQEGLTKADTGREEFLERAWKWKEQYGGRIVTQLKSLGASCDWSREAFTLDEQCSKAVKEVFIKLYNEGLIYQGDRIINWCPDCKTALSDAEVEYEEKDGFFWHIRYPIEGTDQFISVATTRPETMLGDTALAVNPKDDRYKDLVGKNVILPIVNKAIPIVADDYVEMDFGSGVVKITPAHDPNDYEVGLRHNLEVIRVMNDDGTMNELAGKYANLTREKCREEIVKDLELGGYLVKIEPYKHNVGQCYRCRNIVEPIVSKQWFVKMKPLAEPAIDIVKSEEVKFIPQRFEKIYFNWMENIKDWCISRQLWWGHRIPAYYCQDCGCTMVKENAPTKCEKCGSTNIKQDEDVLDTWFSSALWPFSTLGYPDNTEFLNYYYPTNVLVTAYDIIFFWVARMIFSGLKFMDKKPFNDVLIHGIVRDDKGRKMSKSLGNGVDPLLIIDKFGADTLRFSLTNGISPGGDTRFSEEKVEGCRNFMNKIWNASRFVLMNLEGIKLKNIKDVNLTVADKWILAKLDKLIAETTKNLEKYEMGLAANKLYDFVWSDFCDWYIEISKPALYSDDIELKSNTMSTLTYVLKVALKLLHPFIPFITEKLYLSLPHCSESIMISDWPVQDSTLVYENDAIQFENIMEIIKAIRNMRAEKNIAPSKRITLYVKANADSVKLIKESYSYLEKLAGIQEIKIINNAKEIEGLTVSLVTVLAELFVPMGELVDMAKEKERLQGEIDKAQKEILRAEGMLNNQGFVSRAPEKLIDAEKQKIVKFKELKQKLEAQLESMN